MTHHYGRDWAGRLMACTLGAEHRGRRCLGAHGGTLRREREYPRPDAPTSPWVRMALAGELKGKVIA